jgi:hypothetical protein
VNQFSTNSSGDALVSLDEFTKSDHIPTVVNPLKASPAAADKSLSPPQLPPHPPPHLKSTSELVVALYKFESDVDGDLPFKVCLLDSPSPSSLLLVLPHSPIAIAAAERCCHRGRV